MRAGLAELWCFTYREMSRLQAVDDVIQVTVLQALFH